MTRKQLEDEWSDPDDLSPYDFAKPPPCGWQKFMQRNTPRGYDVFCMTQADPADSSKTINGWEWGRSGDPVDEDVPLGLTKVAARAAAWRDLVKRLPESQIWSMVGYILADEESVLFAVPFHLRIALAKAIRELEDGAHEREAFIALRDQAGAA